MKMKRLTDLYIILNYNDPKMELTHNNFIDNTIYNAYLENGCLIARKGNNTTIIENPWDIDSIYESIAIKDGCDLFQIENGFMLQGYYNGIKDESNRIYLYFENQRYY